VCSDGKWSEIPGIDAIPPDLTLSGKTGTRGHRIVAAGSKFKVFPQLKSLDDIEPVTVKRASGDEAGDEVQEVKLSPMASMLCKANLRSVQDFCTRFKGVLPKRKHYSQRFLSDEQIHKRRKSVGNKGQGQKRIRELEKEIQQTGQELGQKRTVVEEILQCLGADPRALATIYRGIFPDGGDPPDQPKEIINQCLVHYDNAFGAGEDEEEEE